MTTDNKKQKLTPDLKSSTPVELSSQKSPSLSTNFVKFYKMNMDAVVPERHSDGAAGYDLRSVDNVSIQPHEAVVVKTGLFIDLNPELFAMVLARSGLAYKNGIEVKNSYVMDRREIEITLKNNKDEIFTVEKGMRVAQMVFFKKAEMRILNVNQKE